MNLFTNEIERMLKSGIALNGMTVGSDGKMVGAEKSKADFLTELAKADADPKATAQLYIDAWNDKSGEKMQALNAMRVRQVNNFIFGYSKIGAAFFEAQPALAADEWAGYTNETGNEVKVGYLGEDGKPDTVRVDVDQDSTKIPIRLLTTKMPRYKTIDVYKGDVRNITKRTLDIARDLAVQWDGELFTLLTASLANGGCFGPFGYETANGNVKSGNKNRATRVYLAHSHVKTANLPTTNDLDLTATAGGTATVDGVAGVIKNPMDTTSGGKFGLLVIEATIHYANLWAGLLPDGGTLTPTGEILVPSADIIQLSQAMRTTANASAQRIQEDINRDGYGSVNLFGRVWRFIPVNDIDTGTCYPRFNLLPGSVWTKPSLDKEFVETNERENWEQRDQRKAFSASIISQHRPRALRIKYA